MPDKSGLLSKEEKKQIQEWLKQKWAGNTNCPVCNKNDWAIGDHTVTTMNIGSGGGILGGQVYPQVMTICKNCGYTMFFNAVMLGLFPPVKDGKDG